MYEKQTWTTGDVITEEKLNHMEDGIASGGSGGSVLIVRSTYDESTSKNILDKTWKEINDAFQSGTMILYKHESAGITAAETTMQVLGTFMHEELGGGATYGVYMFTDDQTPYEVWDTNSETGYPGSVL